MPSRSATLHNRTKSPSFVGLTASSEQSSAIKRRNSKTETKPEIKLRRALWAAGLRYRKNVRRLSGVPDVVFVRSKVVVFCDGDFWHGRNWSDLQPKLRDGSNGAYWVEKIRSNMERDRVTTERLQREGWAVVRVWEKDVFTCLPQVVRSIADLVVKRRPKNDGRVLVRPVKEL